MIMMMMQTRLMRKQRIMIATRNMKKLRPAGGAQRRLAALSVAQWCSWVEWRVGAACHGGWGARTCLA